MRRTFSLILGGMLLAPFPGNSQEKSNHLDLTAQERQMVLDLAIKALKERGLYKGKIYLTHLEVHRDTDDPQSPRNALAIHYRYEGNLAIFTSVNLGRRQVTRVETQADCPTSLSPEELALARQLARESPAVQKALAPYGAPDKLDTDALVAHTVDPKSPSYRHRAVRLLFRQGRTYLLYGPTVEVDLTTQTVRVRPGGDRGHR